MTHALRRALAERRWLDSVVSVASAPADGDVPIWDATNSAWGSGPQAGGNLNFGGYANQVRADAPVDCAPGAIVFGAVVTANPPAWLDATGHILVPGLYCAAASIELPDIGNVGTANGLLAAWGSPFNSNQFFRVDDMLTFLSLGAYEFPTFADTFALAADDLPYSTTQSLTMKGAGTQHLVMYASLTKLL